MAELIDTLIEGLGALPLHALYSGPARARLERDWARARTGWPLEPLLNAIALLALLGAPAAFLLVFSLSSDAALGAGAALLWLSLALASGLKVPALLAQRHASAVESDLPLALRSIALHLSIRLPFEKALEHAAHAQYASSPLWREALSNVRSGRSVSQALGHLSGEVESLAFDQALQALITLYEEGGSPDTLTSLADQLTAQQLASARSAGARAQMASLAFVAVSCLVPAFFLILSVTAGPLLQISIDAPALWLFYGLLLPLANAGVLGALALSAPQLGGLWRPEPLRREVESALSAAGLPWLSSISANLALSLALAGAGALAAFLLGLPHLALLLALGLASLPWLAYSYFESQALSRTRALEADLPPALLSSAGGRFSLERLLDQAARPGAGALAAEAGAVRLQLKAGANPLQALSEWRGRTPSMVLARALDLLMVGYKTGSQMGKALSATASDLLASSALHAERSSVLALQRYTLIGAAAVLVPAILALSLSFSAQVSGLGVEGGPAALSSAPADAGLLSPPAPSAPAGGAGDSPLSDPSAFGASQAPLIRAAAGALPAYLLLNALVGAFFLSQLVGARERFGYYAALLVIGSQLVWALLAPAL